MGIQETPKPRKSSFVGSKAALLWTSNAQFEVHYEVAQGLGRLLNKIPMERVLCHFDPQAESLNPEHVMVQFATPQLAREALVILRAALAAVKPSARVPGSTILTSTLRGVGGATRSKDIGDAFSSIAGGDSVMPWQISTSTVAAGGFHGCLIAWRSCDLALDPGPFCSTRPIQDAVYCGHKAVDPISVKLREVQHTPRRPPHSTPDEAPWMKQKGKKIPKSRFTFSAAPACVKGQ